VKAERVWHIDLLSIVGQPGQEVPDEGQFGREDEHGEGYQRGRAAVGDRGNEANQSGRGEGDNGREEPAVEPAAS
jgi:hypothetical protein